MILLMKQQSSYHCLSVNKALTARKFITSLVFLARPRIFIPALAQGDILA